MERGAIELEPQVREWLERFGAAQVMTAASYIDLPADKHTTEADEQ